MAVSGNAVLARGAGGDPSTTNNVMELTGAIKGLEWVLANRKDEWLVELVSDSQYTLGMANGAWNPSANLELVATLKGLYEKTRCWRARWVPGHTGDTYNEQCDKMAKAEKEKIKAQAKAEAIQKMLLESKAASEVGRSVDQLDRQSLQSSKLPGS